MAEVKALRALRYNPAVVGSLEAVAAPPYDVVDERLRADDERGAAAGAAGGSVAVWTATPGSA